MPGLPRDLASHQIEDGHLPSILVIKSKNYGGCLFAFSVRIKIPRKDRLIDSIENRVRRLEDERAIQRVICNYCFAVDNKRQELWADVFTEDAVLMFKAEPGIIPADSAIGKMIERPIIGRRQLAEWLARLPQFPGPPMKHAAVNTIITLRGDEATADSNLVHFMDREGTPVLLSTGRNGDKFRRCADGQWRIAERIAHMDSMRQGPS